MTQTLTFKTNLNCNSCVAKVRPYLDGEPAIDDWDVDISVPEKTLTVHGDNISSQQVVDAVAQSGFKVLGAVQTETAQTTTDSSNTVTYYPLILVVSYIVGTAALLEYASGGFEWARAMRHFMGGFFVTFSFFKLLDLAGFADSYRMYDVVAKRLPAYGYIYPFVELLLGAAYIANFQPMATNWVTLVVMTISSIGVLQSVLAKRKIRCACLGTVFNLPMSTVTLVEDTLMVAMAALMLVSGTHG